MAHPFEMRFKDRAGWGNSGVNLYEIRTFGANWRSSLVLSVQCPSDMAAIIVAREFARRSQAIEVRCGERLVYRVGLGSVFAGARAVTPKAPQPWSGLSFSRPKRR